MVSNLSFKINMRKMVLEKKHLLSKGRQKKNAPIQRGSAKRKDPIPQVFYC